MRTESILKRLLGTILSDEDTALICRFMPTLKKWWKYANIAGIALAASVILQLPMPLLTRYIIDHVLPAKKASVLASILIIMCGLLLVRLLSSLVSSLYLAVFRERVLIHIRMKMFEHTERLRISAYDDGKTGELISRILNDGGNLQGLMAETILSIVRNCLTLIVVPMAMLVLNWKLGLVSMSLLPCFTYSTRFFSPKIRDRSRRLQESISSVYAALEETLAGIRVVKSFCRERTEANRFFVLLVRTFRESIEYTRTLLTCSGVTSLIEGIAPLIVIWYGGVQVMRGTLTLGTLFAFLSLLGYLYSAAYGLVNNSANINSSLASLKRVYELLDMPTEGEVGAFPSEKEVIKGRITFEDVWFGYNGGPPVLKGLSFNIEPGEVVALVGKSGAGKTTIANLMLRFYEPQSGRILIDGRDIRCYSLKWLRSQIGIVPQGTFLFGRDIAENIKYGKPNAPDIEVKQAAIAANADSFIMNLPNGYATGVGEGGMKLSGGERQRIAIARAILKNPRILILDEATSEVDTDSESLIQDALARLMDGRTTLVVAHRLSTVMRADKVILLEGGKVAAVGTHESLEQTNDHYRHLCRTQLVHSKRER